MTLLGDYAGLAVLVAMAAMVAGDWLRDRGVMAPERPELTAVIAGLLWPLLLVGALQAIALVAVRRTVRARCAGLTEFSLRPAAIGPRSE